MNREHVISDELLKEAHFAFSGNEHWVAYNTMAYFLDGGDMYFFKTAEEAHEFSENNISDYDNYRVIHASSQDELLRQIPYGQNMEKQLTDPDANGLYNKDGNSFTDELIDHFEQQQSINNKKITPMNEKNHDYLIRQLKYAGFGEDLNQQLKQRIEMQLPEFTLTYQKDYGSDQTVATLHFRKSDESDLVFFNRYNLMLKNEQYPDTIKQTFYQGNNEANITLKEAYNLMSGRAVYKEGLTNKEKQEYNAWLQIDFKITDKNGNFKLHPYNEKYGFNLEKALGVHPIIELTDKEQKKRLIESLERGNRQSVSMVVGNDTRKLYIEAAPRFKSLNIYNEAGKRMKPEDLRQSSSAEQSQTSTKKQSQKQTDKGDDDGGEPAKRNSKRKRQSIS